MTMDDDIKALIFDGVVVVCGAAQSGGGHTGICGSSSILGRRAPRLAEESEMFAISALHVNMMNHQVVSKFF